MDLQIFLLEFRRSNIPLLLIWGRHDPHLHVSVAEYMRSNARRSVLHVLDAGHWPQVDAVAAVVRILLADQTFGTIIQD